MPIEEPSQSLVNVSVSDTAGLSKPADSLVNRFFDAVGVFLHTRKEVWTAKAEQQVKLIKAKGAAKLTDFERKVALRRLQEDSKQQRNLESIAEKALPLLKESATPENIDPDWMAQFLDKSRLVSDEDMKTLWAKILAGEACRPGRISKRSLSIVADLDKKSAEAFNRVRSLCFELEGQPLLIVPGFEANGKDWIDFDSILQLQALGLVSTTTFGFSENELPQYPVFHYGERKIQIDLAQQPSKKHPGKFQLETGFVTLTYFGTELTQVCAFEPVEGFFDQIFRGWMHLGATELN